jgi:hypothetical protein
MDLLYAKLASTKSGPFPVADVDTFGRVNSFSLRVVSWCFVCPFVLFLLVIVLSVLFRYTDSDYPFGIFKLFFPCVGVVVSLISLYGVDISLLDRCVIAFELKKKIFGSSLPPVVCRMVHLLLCCIWLFAHSPVLFFLCVLISVLSVKISA